MPFPPKPHPSPLTILIDEREKLPLSFPDYKVEFVTLKVGDYTAKGYERKFAAERKSKDDFLHCLYHDRERLDRQLARLNALPAKLLIIEANALDLERRNWSHADELTPEAINAYIQKWHVRGLPIEFVGTHERASTHVLEFLHQAASELNQAQFFPFLKKRAA